MDVADDGCWGVGIFCMIFEIAVWVSGIDMVVDWSLVMVVRVFGLVW